jgi:bacillithiol system protein YtxJ
MKPLRNDMELEEALNADRAFLFKHSTRCGTSSRAYRQVTEYEEAAGPIPVFLIDVIAERALARSIADRLGVRHQSPQIILLESGRPVWHASHGAVTAEVLTEQAGTPGSRDSPGFYPESDA